eukprot:IDg17616t1
MTGYDTLWRQVVVAVVVIVIARSLIGVASMTATSQQG